MTPLEQLIRYGAYIPVMTEGEQRLLAMGQLHPTVYQICGWCKALAEREEMIEKRFSKSLGEPSKPPKNRK